MKSSVLTRVLSFIFLTGNFSCSEDLPETRELTDDPDSIAFNEVFSTGSPDWIELYNYGEEDIELAGWKVYDQEENLHELPSGAIVEAGGFIILYCDDQGVELNLPFKLSSQGESISILRPDDQIVDRLDFPALDDGQSYARFPDGTGSWQTTGFATPSATNGAGPVSSFKSYGFDPEIPLVGDDIHFTLSISDGANVSEVQIHFRVDETDNIILQMNSTDNLNYSATIPALTSDGELYYYFKLIDGEGNQVLLPNDAMEDPFDMTITSGDVPDLLINEIMASNATTLLDPDGTDEYDDWIEIYNAGSTAVDMGGFYFSDSEDPFDDRIPRDEPNKTIIQPGSHLLFWADSDTEQGPNHLKFKLSAEGETLSLYYKDGRLIDSHKFEIQTTDVSLGRSSDGASNWLKFSVPTPGIPNN